jgi:hypothetical protein
MTKFDITCNWLAAGNDAPEFHQTMGMFGLQVGDISLTQNEDIFSRSIRDTVLVSAYPLANWLAASWWRLMYEALPANGMQPELEWRLAHELGAANHGFVWPQIMFASDREVMQVWALPSRADIEQSVRYINGLNGPSSLSLTDFESKAASFINLVIARLEARGIPDTALSNLWKEIIEERDDPKVAKMRRLEAEMGFDPDECPDDVMKLAVELNEKMGNATLSELAPVYGKCATEASLFDLDNMLNSKGIVGTPNVPSPKTGRRKQGMPPWQRAVEDARHIRQTIGTVAEKISNKVLCDLLGIQASEIDHWISNKIDRAAFAVPASNKQFHFHPRKKHPLAKRFELARFIGDILQSRESDKPWLASTDVSTSRQKYQRAFAAEFLCPIQDLTEFLDNDFSEDAIEDAAQHFEVSVNTATSLLLNNGLISSPYQSGYWGMSSI